jgi:hypothetical protein
MTLWAIVILDQYLRAILELIVHALVNDPSRKSCPNKLVVMAIDNEFPHNE